LRFLGCHLIVDIAVIIIAETWRRGALVCTGRGTAPSASLAAADPRGVRGTSGWINGLCIDACNTLGTDDYRLARRHDNLFGGWLLASRGLTSAAAAT
jgi:hypothetical protein